MTTVNAITAVIGLVGGLVAATVPGYRAFVVFMLGLLAGGIACYPWATP